MPAHLSELETSQHGPPRSTGGVPQTGDAEAQKLADKQSDHASSEVDEFETAVTFKVWDVPPWPLTLALGFQHYLTMLGATVLIPTLIVPAMGGSDDDLAQTIQSVFFVSGLVTLFGTVVGNRLPIIQSGSFSFITPAFSIIATVAARGGFDCPEDGPCSERFRATIRELSGAIVGAATFQVFVGYSGLMSVMLRFISPVTIAPTIALVGLSLFTAGWGDTQSGVGSCVQIGIPTIILLVFFSQYLRHVTVKIPSMPQSLPIFTLFPVLFSISIMWIIAVIYTEAGDPSNTFCRTDNSNVLDTTPWIRVPYPGQWGAPTFNASSVFAMFAGVLAGMIESVGDYYACARLAGAPPPPVHAVSRGIGFEGVGCIVAGLIGTGGGTTSYSENVGAIGLTGVGSRRVVQVAASFMVVLSIIGKFGALFASLPTPIVGGLFCVMFGMITGIGLSNAQYTNQANMRNIFILGFSLYNGLSISSYFTAYEESEGNGPVNTSNQEFNDVVNTFFKTSIAVGLLIALILDNTLPGSKEDRGLTHWNMTGGYKSMTEKGHKAYDLPFGLSPKIEYPILDAATKANEAVFGCCRRRTRKGDGETDDPQSADLPQTADHAV